MGEIIACGNCQSCKEDVAVLVFDPQTFEEIDLDFIDKYCILKFKPVLTRGITLGCSEGAKRNGEAIT